MDDGIEMEIIFGDGSQQTSGFLGALMSAGRRLLTGESLFMTVFQNRGQGKKRVAFGAPYLGKIPPVHLAEIGDELIAQKDSFLCAAKGVSVGIALNKKIGAGLFGGEGFIMQRLLGNGWAFLHAGGNMHEACSPWDRFCGETRAALLLFSLRWPTTFNTLAKSNPPCSVARDCSSPRCAAQEKSGFSRCLSAAWLTASSPRRARPGGKKKARSWAVWVICSTATVELNPLPQRGLNQPRGPDKMAVE